MTKSKVEENHVPTNQCWRVGREWYQLETAPGVIPYTLTSLTVLNQAGDKTQGSKQRIFICGKSASTLVLPLESLQPQGHGMG